MARSSETLIARVHIVPALGSDCDDQGDQAERMGGPILQESSWVVTANENISVAIFNKRVGSERADASVTFYRPFLYTPAKPYMHIQLSWYRF